MTLEELSKEPQAVRYRFLDSFWWQGEGYLAHLLPDNEEGKAIYGEFQALRYRIHDLLLASELPTPQP